MVDHADLGPRLERFVTSLVDAGRFKSRMEVLRAGVRMIEEQEEMLARLDGAIGRGVADADAGRVKPLHEVLERMSSKYRAMAVSADDT